MHSLRSEPLSRDALLARLRERAAEYEEAGDLVRPVSFDRLGHPELAATVREMFERIRTLELEPLSIEERVQETLARQINAIIQFHISGPEGGDCYLDFAGDDGFVRAGVTERARMTIAVSETATLSTSCSAGRRRRGPSCAARSR